MKNIMRVMVAGMLLLCTSASYATTVTYILDQSNALQDGVDYISVTLSDETSGQLDFWVETRPVLSDNAGRNFGIQSFAFSHVDLLDLSAEDFIVPDRWSVRFKLEPMSQAGKFDVRLLGRGNSRQDPLHFSVLGLTIDDVFGSFAAHVADFAFPGSGCGPGGDIPGDFIEEGECDEEHRSAFFFGGRLEEPSPIPLPASLWLFGSGLMGMSFVGRRVRRS